MKKNFYQSAMALIAIAMLSLTSCGLLDLGGDSNSSKLEKSYISIENGVYHDGEFPAATIDEELEGIELSDQIMNGAVNFITVNTQQTVNKFFIGINGVNGYLEYVPEPTRAASSLKSYVIPLMIAQNYAGNCELRLSAELQGGAVTIPSNIPLYQIETRPGTLEIKLSFNNEKDIDIHLFTPSGIHIYYGTSNGGYYYGDDYYLGDNYIEGDLLEFGLDIDSNADCSIDGVNKENIYIPKKFLENGTYRVAVDLYRNCDPSIPTSWSIVSRYNGDIINPVTGSNPAMGTFEVGAPSSYAENLVEVMTFTISNGTRSAASVAPLNGLHKNMCLPISAGLREKIQFGK